MFKNWKWTHCVLAAALAVSLVSGGLVLAYPPVETAVETTEGSLRPLPP